jgi:hypothetical protein
MYQIVDCRKNNVSTIRVYMQGQLSEDKDVPWPIFAIIIPIPSTTNRTASTHLNVSKWIYILFLVENYCLMKQMSLQIFTEQVIFTYHNIYGEYITN